MSKLIAILVVLCVVSTASGIGVGVAGHYNISIPTRDLTDYYGTSFLGFDLGVEIAVFRKYLIVSAGFGFQSFENKEYGHEGERVSVTPVSLGFEYPLALGRTVVCFGAGGALFFEHTETGVGGFPSLWVGTDIYYTVTPDIDLGAGVKYHFERSGVGAGMICI
ncbi:MAG: hypothetical protein JSW52_04065, partial [Candidatus Coatesbacteria bacterium]